ncbi:ABC transporter substrate-binding protein [Methanoregula sp.]|uniref:ABC transporter substrate-binding protein n=1 Tax=Methanoregula sp. TaxID=2052170 RepID=UPI000CBFF240|nr:ABC transporter substrate-binding protein [Methanoregula sp.]PKG34002.1 MAG: ABC transporter substrate-binding protein [Methanoregula sp.]
MKYSVLIIAALLIAAACIAGCAQQPSSTQESSAALQDAIKIGVIASLTGPASNVGTNMWQSAQIAADKINAAGGVTLKDGTTRQVRLIVGDDESTQAGGQKAATKLITDDKVDILVGGYSSAVTSAYQQIIAEYKVPYIVTGASSPIITHRTDIDTSYVFHHCPTTDTYGEYTTTFIDEVVRAAVNKKLGAASDRPFRLAVLYQDTAFGKGVQTAVGNTITKKNLNIELVSLQSFKMGESDFRTQLTAIKAAKPDAVYIAAFPNEGAPAIVQARRDIGLNTIFLNVENNDNSQFYKDLGQYGEYAIIESRFSPYIAPAGAVAAAQDDFKQAYYKKFGTYPDMMGASTYEGVFIATEGIKSAGTTDKTAVREALTTLKMPQVIEAMKDSTISFSSDFRESSFDLWMEQLHMDAAAGETRPKIIWPDNLKTTEFVLPSWYEAGSSA